MKLTEKKVFRPLMSNLLRENPAFSTAAGICVLLFAAGSLETALGVGIADTVLLTLLTFLPFCFAKLPEKAVPLLTVLIGTIVTALLAVLLNTETLPLAVSLLPCLLLGQNLGRRDHPFLSLWHGFTKGVGLLLGLLLTAILRELLGVGSIAGTPVLSFALFPLLTRPLGLFFLVGILCAVKNGIAPSSHREQEDDTIPASLSDGELEFASEIEISEDETESESQKDEGTVSEPETVFPEEPEAVITEECTDEPENAEDDLPPFSDDVPEKEEQNQ